MEDVVVQVQLPRDVVQALETVGLKKESLPGEIRRAFGVSLFQRRLFSIGKAAEVAGLPLAGFQDLLVEHGVPVVEYTEQDLEEDSIR